jgi:hypothetical protein
VAILNFNFNSEDVSLSEKRECFFGQVANSQANAINYCGDDVDGHMTVK